MSIAKIAVNAASKSYEISVGKGLLHNSDLFKDLIGRQSRRIALLSDRHVGGLYGDALQDLLQGLGHNVTRHMIEPGEGSKSFENFGRIMELLIADKIERKDVIIALGGGVVGDLSGFAAATLRRGTRFIQVPTSLLAQVDSSVGGKTAINSPQGKNLIGAFYQPEGVVIDTDCLKTLPKRELQAGFAEVVKYGLINDPEFFSFLEENAARLYENDEAFLTRIIAHSCKAKAQIVAEDEREEGNRALLNLGHTFGHAIEALAGYDGRILHGEAVAIGMVMALEVSQSLGIAPEGQSERLIKLYQSCGMKPFMHEYGIDFTPDALIKAMAQDKKVEANKLVFILGDIGKAHVARDIDINIVHQALTRLQNVAKN